MITAIFVGSLKMIVSAMTIKLKLSGLALEAMEEAGQLVLFADSQDEVTAKGLGETKSLSAVPSKRINSSLAVS